MLPPGRKHTREPGEGVRTSRQGARVCALLPVGVCWSLCSFFPLVRRFSGFRMLLPSFSRADLPFLRIDSGEPVQKWREVVKELCLIPHIMQKRGITRLRFALPAILSVQARRYIGNHHHFFTTYRQSCTEVRPRSECLLLRLGKNPQIRQAFLYCSTRMLSEI